MSFLGPTIYCVLRHSQNYDASYVERLREQCTAYAPDFNFVCLSNVSVPCDTVTMHRNWPGWWSKMELFRPDIKGDIFYLDLDTVILDKIDDFLAAKSLVALSDFYRPVRIGSGLMYLPESIREPVWRVFVNNASLYMHQYKIGGDQAFLHMIWGQRPKRWQEIVPNRVISYKAHKVASKGVPVGTGIMCYHGFPKQRDLNWEIPGMRYDNGKWERV